MNSLPLRVIIPVNNAKEYVIECIGSVVSSLNELTNWSIIVVDNGKNQALKKKLKNFPVQVIKRDEIRSAAYARNEGAANFYKGILLFFDCDVIIENGCIKKLIQPIIENSCDATFGSYSANVSSLYFAQKFKQLYVNYIYNRNNTEVRNFFWTAICAIKSEVFHKLNGFNSGFTGANSEDQELGIRLTKNGYIILPIQSAQGVHRHLYTIKSIFKNDLIKGITSIRNMQKNKIPLTDNNHAKRTDIYAVIFATLAIMTVLGTIISIYFFLFSFFFLLIWFLFRHKLLSVFANQGLAFLFKSSLLLYSLELIRALCVIICITSSKTVKNEHT
jgi:GT2 family glycosyltransferase